MEHRERTNSYVIDDLQIVVTNSKSKNSLDGIILLAIICGLVLAIYSSQPQFSRTTRPQRTNIWSNPIVPKSTRQSPADLRLDASRHRFSISTNIPVTNGSTKSRR